MEFKIKKVLNLSSLNLRLPSSSTTNRELFSQFSTSSSRRWLEVGCIEKTDIVFVLEITPFKPEFTMVIFIHYKPRIAVAILDF